MKEFELVFLFVTPGIRIFPHEHSLTVCLLSFNGVEISLGACSRLQAALKSTGPDITGSPDNEVRVLRPGFDGLKTGAHRRMFLDAALLLHGHPPGRLLKLWAAQLRHDADSPASDG